MDAAIQEGTRVHEQMAAIAQALSDTQMTDVAVCCNAVQIEAIKVSGQ